MTAGGDITTISAPAMDENRSVARSITSKALCPGPRLLQSLSRGSTMAEFWPEPLNPQPITHMTLSMESFSSLRK